MEQGTFDLIGEDAPTPVKFCECGCGLPAPIARQTNTRRGAVKGQPSRFIRGHYSPPAGKPQPGKRKLSVEIGQRIGRSVVIDPEVQMTGPDGADRRGARLRCDCGNEFDRLLMVLLRNTDTASCGCGAKRFADRAGQRFGRLTAICRIEDKARRPGGTTRWLCLCDCGNEVVAAGADLVRGHTKSCGCLKKMVARRGLAEGEAAFNRVLCSYRQNAQKRGHAWELTEADFKRLTSADCFYCGAPPAMIGKVYAGNSGTCIYNGLDRKDNALGYTLGNVLTCCKVCNHAKRDMSYDDFLAWIARLTEYHFFHPEVMPSWLLAART